MKVKNHNVSRHTDCTRKTLDPPEWCSIILGHVIDTELFSISFTGPILALSRLIVRRGVSLLTIIYERLKLTTSNRIHSVERPQQLSPSVLC